MQRNIPKNIRQIGYANENDKVYMEDYVDTYLNQLCNRAKEHAEGAFLIGEQIRSEGKWQTYIFGAIRMDEVDMTDGKPDISEMTYQAAQEECKNYFPDGSILGWFLAADGYVSGVDANLLRQHEKYLGKPNTFLLLREPESRDENFYIYRDREFERLSGHYIYYEKNPSMQNYMIDQRKGVGIEPKSTMTDEAAQSFRQILQQKEKKRMDTGTAHRLSYALSTILVLVVLAMGIGAFNDYDGLAGLKSAIGASSGKVNSRENTETDMNSSVLNPDTDTADSSDTETQNTAEQNTAEQNTAEQNTAEQNVAEQNAAEQNAGGQSAGEPVPTGSDNQMTAEMEAQSESTEGQSGSIEGQASEKNYYTVKKGDTLASISRRMYGTTSKVKEICSVNNISNVDLIIEGQKIVLP